MPDGTKPLPNPMLNCQEDPREYYICVFSWCAYAFNHNIYLKAAVSFNRNHQLTTTMIVCLQSTCCVLNQKFCGTKEAVQFGKCTWNSFHTHSWSVQQFLFLSISFVQSFWKCMQSNASDFERLDGFQMDWPYIMHGSPASIGLPCLNDFGVVCAQWGLVFVFTGS